MNPKSPPGERDLPPPNPLEAGRQSDDKLMSETSHPEQGRDETGAYHCDEMRTPPRKRLLKRTIRFLRQADDRLSRLLDADISNWHPSPLSPAESPKVSDTRTTGLALVAGRFSDRRGGATFGDTEAMRVVTHWLADAGMPFHIAGHRDYGYAGVDLETVDPKAYTHFIYVCGPWDPKRDRGLLQRFEHCTRIGVDLSVQGHEHGFDVCLPRDHLNQVNPDLAFGSLVPRLPLAGVSLIHHRQSEYGKRQRHERVGAIVSSYLARGEIAAIPLDTRHQSNPTGVPHASAYENLVRRLDVVITTRMHGLVFAIKCGTPAVAIDPIAGGAKVSAQARALDWPVLDGDSLCEQELADTVAWALEDERKAEITERQERALKRLEEIHRTFTGLFE